MQYIQSLKRLISLCLVTVILLTSTLIIFPSSASADEVMVSPSEQALVCLSVNKEMLEQAKAKGESTFSEDLGALGFIGTLSSAAAANLGSITILTTTTTAHGILALLGAGTTTVFAVPAAGAVAVSGLLAYGGYKVIKYMQSQDNQNLQDNNPCLPQS